MHFTRMRPDGLDISWTEHRAKNEPSNKSTKGIFNSEILKDKAARTALSSEFIRES